MKKLEELKMEYVEFMNKLNEIDTKILSAVDKNNEINRNPLFFYLDNYNDSVFESWKEDDIEWQLCDKELLQENYEEYNKSIEKAIKLRNKLFEERHEIYLRYTEWAFKYNINWKAIREFGEIKEIEIDWRGWDSSNYVYESMIYSINLTNEEEVNKIINDMEKIINIIESDGCEPCGLIEYIDYLRIVNNETRYYLNEDCMTTLALDIMENHGIYNPFRESFKSCILRISKMIDYEFLYYLKETDYIDNK